MSNLDDRTDLTVQIQRDITEEIFKAANFPRNRIFRKIIGQLFNTSTRNFSGLIVDLDNTVKNRGFVEAARQALPVLVQGVTADGHDRIPQTGPLIIASNHPGTYDAFSIISQMPRDDIKMIVSGIPFFNDLPNAGRHFIYSTRDMSVRADAIRKSIRHLSAGGALLIFPSGRIDPDPAVLPEAAENLGRWSRSLNLFLDKVQNTQLVLAITSGVLSGRFLNHPFPRLFKNDHERRRVIEFMQVIRQMFLQKPLDLQPKVSFSVPLSLPEISARGQQSSIADIVRNARLLLSAHLQRYYS